MRLLLIAGLSLTSLTAFAEIKDTFNCKLNLKRGIQTQAFQLKQSLTIERKIIPYPSGEGKNRTVTEGIIPFEVYLQWDKILAKVTYRNAIESDESGRVLRAAQWQCFEATIETAEGIESITCGDKNRTDDPFADPRQRWQATRVSDGLPSWPAGIIFFETFRSGDDILTLECKQ